jgi:hypothetical protein
MHWSQTCGCYASWKADTLTPKRSLIQIQYGPPGQIEQLHIPIELHGRLGV